MGLPHGNDRKVPEDADAARCPETDAQSAQTLL